MYEIVNRFVVMSCRLTIGDVREGSDEEHITYSGGKEIFDLLQCGWGERKDEKQEKKKMIKYEIWGIVKCDKMKILVFIKILENYNIIILENDKYFIVKKCSYSLKIGLNSLKSSTIYAYFYGF